MNVHQRSNTHPTPGDTQHHLKELFNNHLGFTVADLFQHATTHRHHPLELADHPPPQPNPAPAPAPPPPSIISNSVDPHRPLILSLQNHPNRLSPLTNQDHPSPPHDPSKLLSINTALGFETPLESTRVHTHPPNPSAAPPLPQSAPFQLDQSRQAPPSNPTLHSSNYDRTSITPPIPNPIKRFSSATTSISPTSNPHATHEESVPGSGPGSSSSSSSSSRSPPNTDSSASSRHTDHSANGPSDLLTPPSIDPAHLSSSAFNSGLVAISSSHAILGPRSRPCRDFEPQFGSKPNYHLPSAPITSIPFAPTFNEHNHSPAQHQPAPFAPIIPKLESSTNSSPSGLNGKTILAGPAGTSTDPSSPQLNNIEPSAPPSTHTLAPVWSQTTHNPAFPVAADAFNQRQHCQVFYTSQAVAPPTQSLSPTDPSNPTRKQPPDQRKSADSIPFSVQNSSVSPSTTAGWSTDESCRNPSSNTILCSGNLHVPPENQVIFGFPPSHPPTQGPGYANSIPVDHHLKFPDGRCHPSNNNSNHSNSLGLLPPYHPSQPRASYMEKIPENLVVLGEVGSTGLKNHGPHQPEETGHNAVEKRYRNNINSHIAALADLVPALQHLRSLPSAATSRRHSSQFIVSTSAIGKIPTGLVDGVKAATKLSKGNILSKSVDYMRHLLRRRAELKEDIDDLKAVVKSRVDGGERLIHEWEERVNSKSPERQRQRMLEQNQGEEDGDEDDEMNESCNKKPTGGSFNAHGLNSSKKRKVSDLKTGELNGKFKPGRIAAPKTMRKTPNSPEFRNSHVVSANPDSILSSESLPPGSHPGSFVQTSVCGRPESLSRMTHDLVDELDVLREPPSNYHHQFIGHEHNTYEYHHTRSSEFSSDFMGHPFAPAPTPEPRTQQTTSNMPSRPLLAVFMGLSFAVGSGYNYHQSWRTPGQDSGTWSSPDKSKFAEACSLLNGINSPSHGFSCGHEKTLRNPNPSVIDSSNPLAIRPLSISQAGLNAISIASIIWTLLLIIKPEFILNYFGPDRLRRSKEVGKTKRKAAVMGNVDNDSNDSTDPEGEEPEDKKSLPESISQVDPSSAAGSIPEDEDDQILLGRSQKHGKIQYDRLCVLAGYPRNWVGLIGSITREITSIVGNLIWGEVIEKMVQLQGNKLHGKRRRMSKIKSVLAWTRIAEIESSWDFARASFFKRVHTALKLYNLCRELDWRDRVTREELDYGKITAILALSGRAFLGDSNLISQMLWRKATEFHKADRSAVQSAKTSAGSILPASYHRNSFQRVAENSWLNEALILGYDEVCEILTARREHYKLMSAEVEQFGGNRGWSPLKQIVETRAELELIEIWSRIFVSMISKTCPVDKTLRDDRIRAGQVGLDGGLAELPTRLEEAGAPHALQISQGRRKVEQSIERICRLRLGSGSSVGRMARVTRGMWAIAFGRRQVGVEVAEELRRLEQGSDDSIGCIGPFLELVLGFRLSDRKREEKARIDLTLDKLAKMTIDWLLIRREHLILRNGPKLSTKRMMMIGIIDEVEMEERKRRLRIKCRELKVILDLAIHESEKNRELNARSTKQTDEAIQAGEARELDLRTAIQECQRSIMLVEDQN